MNSLKVNGKVYNYVKDVKIVGDFKEITIYIKDYYSNISSIKIKTDNLRIECKGNVGVVNSNNCATVYGNIVQSTVQNCAYVDGFIKDYCCPRGSISIDNSIYICHGSELIKRNGMTVYDSSSSTKAKVIKIDASDYLNSLSVDVSNIRCEVVVFGSVNTITVGNCLYTKGIVESCSAGNALYMTAGLNKAKSTKTILQERAERNKEIDDSLNNIFKNVF